MKKTNPRVTQKIEFTGLSDRLDIGSQKEENSKPGVAKV